MTQRNIYPANNILKKLVIYVNEGAKSELEQKLYERVLKVLEQLDDDELRYVKAKYIDLAYRVDGTNIINIPSFKDIKLHLNMKPKDLNLLIERTNNKVVEHHTKLVDEELEAEKRQRKTEKDRYLAKILHRNGDSNE